jgi:hypothetical protein
MPEKKNVFARTFDALVGDQRVVEAAINLAFAVGELAFRALTAPAETKALMLAACTRNRRDDK